MTVDQIANHVPTEPAEAPEEFFDEMDDARRTGGKSCCTVWTLGMILITFLIFGMWVIFKL